MNFEAESIDLESVFFDLSLNECAGSEKVGVYIIFYTADNDYKEALQYYDALSISEKFFNWLNYLMGILISWITGATLVIDEKSETFMMDDSRMDNFDKNYLTTTTTTQTESKTQNIICDEKLTKNQNNYLSLDGFSDASFWQAEYTNGNLLFYRPNFTHVEIRIGSISYSLRNGAGLKAYKCKKYNTPNTSYCTLMLNLDPKREEKLKDICNSCCRNKNRFNHFGPIFNFLLPKWLRAFFCCGKRSYKNKNLLFCSEFIAKILCRVGVLKNFKKYKSGAPTATENIFLEDVRKKIPIDFSELHYVMVDPSTTSPNSLYVSLMLQLILVRKNPQNYSDIYLKDFSQFAMVPTILT